MLNIQDFVIRKSNMTLMLTERNIKIDRDETFKIRNNKKQETI